MLGIVDFVLSTSVHIANGKRVQQSKCASIVYSQLNRQREGIY